MNYKIKKWISVFALCLSFSAFANGNLKGINCTYQTGYGEGAFFLGYDFDLETQNFHNLVTKSVGTMDTINELEFAFLEGVIIFDKSFNYAIFKPERVINEQTEYVLKCKLKAKSQIVVEKFEFDLISEDEMDGELKSNLDFLNYCGSSNAVLKVDISKYVPNNSPWASGKIDLFGNRDQFGPSYNCLPGERRRENFKVLNQLLNEAREKNNKVNVILSIKKEQFAPSGYAIKVEIISKKLNRSFFFYDNLNSAYSL